MKKLLVLISVWLLLVGSVWAASDTLEGQELTSSATIEGVSTTDTCEGVELASGCSFASQDLDDDYTEVDTTGRLTVADSSITFDDIQNDEDSWVYKDFGADYFSGDFTVRFQWELTFQNSNGRLVLASFLNETGGTRSVIDDPDDEDDDGLYLYIRLSGGITRNFRIATIEDGSSSEQTGASEYAEDTTFYVTLTRDDDGGANSTGQVTAYLCTTAYCTSGVNLVTSVSIDCSTGEQNDFRYFYAIDSYNAGEDFSHDGTISDHEIKLCID